MKSMSELLNLFVDGEIATQQDAINLLCAEVSEALLPVAMDMTSADFINAYAELRARVVTATRLLPPMQAERIKQLLDTSEEKIERPTAEGEVSRL